MLFFTLLAAACGPSPSAVGVSYGAGARATSTTSDGGSQRPSATWPMPHDYRTALPKIVTGNVSRGHDQGHYLYDLYRRTDESGDMIVMDHFAIDRGQAISFAYMMKKSPGALAWTYGVVSAGPAETKNELSSSATSLGMNDATCEHCHSEAPHNGLFSIR